MAGVRLVIANASDRGRTLDRANSGEKCGISGVVRSYDRRATEALNDDAVRRVD
jgi:hypothetical protein